METPKSYISIDDAIDRVGTRGRYQFYLGLFYFLINIILGLTTVQFPILTMTPEIDCISTKCSEISHPSLVEGSDLCVLRRREWEFTTPKTNWLTEYDLYCESEYLRSCGVTAYFGGFFVTVLAASYFIDKNGRRPISVYFSAAMIVTLILQKASSALQEIFFFRFIFGILHSGLSVSTLLVCVESTGQRQGWFLCIIGSVGFSLGETLMAYLGLHKDEWQSTFDVPICIAVAAFLIVYLIVPESPPWFHSKGRVLQSVVALNEIARVNRNPLLNNFWLKDNEETASGTESLRALKGLLGKITLAWLAGATCYYVIPTTGISDQAYLLTIVRGAGAVPLKLILYMVVQTYGRKRALMCISLLAAGCVLATSISKLDPTSSGHLAVCAISNGVAESLTPLLYIYTVEFLPTAVRARGVGLCTMVAASTSVFSPFVLLLHELSAVLVVVVPVVLLTLTTVLTSYLPETLHWPLPATLAELTAREALDWSRDQGKSSRDTEMTTLLLESTSSSVDY